MARLMLDRQLRNARVRKTARLRSWGSLDADRKEELLAPFMVRLGREKRGVAINVMPDPYRMLDQ